MIHDSFQHSVALQIKWTTIPRYSRPTPNSGVVGLVEIEMDDPILAGVVAIGSVEIIVAEMFGVADEFAIGEELGKECFDKGHWAVIQFFPIPRSFFLHSFRYSTFQNSGQEFC